MALARGETTVDGLPFFLEGSVVKGFGRGSKELGIPTANLPIEPYEDILAKIPVGVYCGWACVNNGPVHKMAMSIGWNPYYKNTKKTLEVHLMHEFADDFYGQQLRAIPLHYMRNELDFTTIENLIQAIKDDITYANEYLERPENKRHQSDAFFSASPCEHS
eukprot:TRINITY_DN3226_c0_g1_i1.p2 TRINITY_DN3226_c0_g1~~TRINITY_DN3226_c0_g1_i1.p2  ORF type:complete len:162 (+),score=33.94 TRINITY_DN3226_c0_g1_i1:51-536(+)